MINIRILGISMIALFLGCSHYNESQKLFLSPLSYILLEHDSIKHFLIIEDTEHIVYSDRLNSCSMQSSKLCTNDKSISIEKIEDDKFLYVSNKLNGDIDEVLMISSQVNSNFERRTQCKDTFTISSSYQGYFYIAFGQDSLWSKVSNEDLIISTDQDIDPINYASLGYVFLNDQKDELCLTFHHESHNFMKSRAGCLNGVYLIGFNTVNYRKVRKEKNLHGDILVGYVGFT